MDKQGNRVMVELANAPVSGAQHAEFEPSDDSDESLASRAAHDPDAMTELYRRYRPIVEGYCRQKIADPERAQDVISQIFLSVLEGLKCKKIARVRPWIFTIAHNEIIDAYRSFRIDVPLERVFHLRDEKQTPEDVAIENSEMQMLRTLIESLPEWERMVMERRLFGLTNPEISEMLGKSYSWVGSTQHRAYTRLKTLVREQNLVGDRS